MSSANAFALLALGLLLGMFGFSYYDQRYRLVRRLLGWRAMRWLLWPAIAALLLLGGVALWLGHLIGLVLGFMALVLFLIGYTGDAYPWLSKVLLMAAMFTLIHAMLVYLEGLSLVDWMRIKL